MRHIVARKLLDLSLKAKTVDQIQTQREIKGRVRKRPKGSTQYILDGKKICSKCNAWFPITWFCSDSSKPTGLSSPCKTCSRKQKKEYYLRDPKGFTARNLSCQRKNQEKTRARKLRYSRSEKGKAKQREYKKDKRYRYYPKTPEAKLKALIRKKFCVIKRLLTKKTHTFDFVGYTVGDLMQRLEFNFKKGMTWENHGKVWHIDHKKPLKYFDYTDEKQIKLSWSLCNLQPLFALDNLRKSGTHPLKGKI